MNNKDKKDKKAPANGGMQGHKSNKVNRVVINSQEVGSLIKAKALAANSGLQQITAKL